MKNFTGFIVAMLLLAVVLLTAGCPYHVPLTEEHTLLIDQELFGAWIESEDPEKDKDKQTELIIMPFSETEYVLCYHSNLNGTLYLRGYPINMGGVSCVQLQLIGPVNFNPAEPYSADNKSNHYGVATYEIKGGTLEVRLLNKKVVSDKITTSEALQEAFLANIDNERLFQDLVVFRDTGAHADQRLRLKPIVDLVDESLPSRPRACANNPSSPEFAVITTNGGIHIYDYAGKVIHSAKHTGSVITSISYSADGILLLAGTKSGDLLIWNRGSNHWKTVAEHVENTIDLVAWLGDEAFWGKRVYYGTNRKPINRSKPSGGIIDPISGQAGWTFTANVASLLQSLATSPDGKRLAVYGIPDQPKGIYILDATTGQVQSFLLQKSQNDGAFSVCIAPDNKTIAVGYDPDIILWNADDESAIKTLAANSVGASLAFSPDGRLLLSGMGDSTARIWLVETGEEIGRLRFPGSNTLVHSVGFSPDGKTFYALGDKGILKIAEMREERP